MIALLTIPWILIILGWIIFNLYNKNKKLEGMVINQSDFISKMINQMKTLDKTIEKIDTTIWVQSDPTLLELFDSVKQFQSDIKTYTELL
jgi:hypothetical protein